MVKVGNSKGKILITQELTSQAKELFNKLGKKYNIEVKYHSFVKSKGLGVSNFRKLGINVREYTAIIFINKVAVDNFYDLMKKLDIELPLTIRYFCPSEHLAMYLQKYITLRKRRLHYPKKVKGKEDLIKLIDSHKDEKFLFVGRLNATHKILQHLKKKKYSYTFLPVYELVPNPYNDVKELEEMLLITFSAVAAVEAFVELLEGNEKLREVPIGIYGAETKKVAKKHKLNVVFAGPTKEKKTLYSLIDSYLGETMGAKS